MIIQERCVSIREIILYTELRIAVNSGESSGIWLKKLHKHTRQAKTKLNLEIKCNQPPWFLELP